MTVESLDYQPIERGIPGITPSPRRLCIPDILQNMIAAIAGLLAVDTVVVLGAENTALADLYLVHESAPSGFPREFLAATVPETLIPIALSDAGELPEISRTMGFTATLLIPCTDNGGLLAMFAFHHRYRSHHWTVAEITAARAMVDNIAITLSIALQQIRFRYSTEQQIRSLQRSESQVKRINQFLLQSVLERFLPASIVSEVAGGEPVLDLPPQPREITVLFSDMVGFTPLSIRLGPKKIAALLNEYLTTMTRAVHEGGGTVDKFMGDAIFVLFGAPETLSLEEQASRAIATARVMHRYLEELNRKWREIGLIGGDIPPVRFRCGIHQGNAIVGMFGGEKRSDYTAIGPAVNIASRLQEAADANTILVSRSIARYLDRSQITRVETLKLKGIEEETVAYSVAIESN